MKSSPLASQKQEQKILLSPQIRQLMHILQLPLADLKVYLEQEMVNNPLLEGEDKSPPELKDSKDAELQKEIKDSVDFNFDLGQENLNAYLAQDQQVVSISEQERKRRFQESLISKSPTLQEELFKQLRMVKLSAKDMLIGEKIIENIDADGYLKVNLSEIINETVGAKIKDLDKILSLIQTFTPLGVGARNILECLLLQLKAKDKEDSLAAKIIKSHWKTFVKKKYKQISRMLNCTPEQIKEAEAEISKLDLKPGGSYGPCEIVSIRPEVSLEPFRNGYEILLKNEELPRLKINSNYSKILKDKNASEKAKIYVKGKLKSAVWLIEALKQRNQTLLKVVRCITTIQSSFLKGGPAYLKPLTLKEVARKTGLHPSTVSRVVANKYIETPQGTLELKKFFSGAVPSEGGNLRSVETIKAQIKKIIDRESKLNPLTDEEIVSLLSKKSVRISRRTVSKYRQQLGILPSSLRKEQ